jgi:hypothetical protein
MTGTRSAGKGGTRAVFRNPTATGRLDQGALTVCALEPHKPFWVFASGPLFWTGVDDSGSEASCRVVALCGVVNRGRATCSRQSYDWLWDCTRVWPPSYSNNNLQYVYEFCNSSKSFSGDNSLGNYLSYCYPCILDRKNKNHSIYYNTISLSWEHKILDILKQLGLPTAIPTRISIAYRTSMNTISTTYPLNFLDVSRGHVEGVGSQHSER